MSASRRAIVAGALVAVVLVAVVLQGVNAAQEMGARQQQTQAVDDYRAAVTATDVAYHTFTASWSATSQAGATRQAGVWATQAAEPRVAWTDLYDTPTPAGR